MVDPPLRITQDAEPHEGSQRQESIGVIAAGGEGDGARFARPKFCTRRLLDHPQPACVVGVRLRIQEHLHILYVETELRDARHDHGRGGGIATVEEDVALGSGDEEGRGIARADVVQFAAMRNGSASPCPPRFVALSHLPTSTSAMTLTSPDRTTSRYRLVK
jgi:hypothetical protein